LHAQFQGVRRRRKRHDLTCAEALAQFAFKGGTLASVPRETSAAQYTEKRCGLALAGPGLVKRNHGVEPAHGVAVPPPTAGWIPAS
jgi:hypothetical protein